MGDHHDVIRLLEAQHRAALAKARTVVDERRRVAVLAWSGRIRCAIRALEEDAS